MRDVASESPVMDNSVTPVGRPRDTQRVIAVLQKARGNRMSYRQIQRELGLPKTRFAEIKSTLLKEKSVKATRGGALELINRTPELKDERARSEPWDEAQINDSVREAVQAYEDQRDRYKKLVDFVHGKCQALIRDKIRATIQSRTKDPERYAAKIRRYLLEDKARKLYDAKRILARSGDLAGVRVTTYIEGDRAKVVELIREAFSGPNDGEVQVDVMDGKAKTPLYRATHCQVMINDNEAVGDNRNLRGVGCEIQVCSLLAHVFNEIEHDITYKPLGGAVTEREKRILAALGGLTLAGDEVIVTLLEAVERRQMDSAQTP